MSLNGVFVSSVPNGPLRTPGSTAPDPVSPELASDLQPASVTASPAAAAAPPTRKSRRRMYRPAGVISEERTSSGSIRLISIAVPNYVIGGARLLPHAPTAHRRGQAHPVGAGEALRLRAAGGRP